jgi:hypothetical protein
MIATNPACNNIAATTIVDGSANWSTGVTALAFVVGSRPWKGIYFIYTGDHPIEISIDGSTTFMQFPGTVGTGSAAGTLGYQTQSYDLTANRLFLNHTILCKRLQGGTTPTVGVLITGALR